ncbi:premnaspirodiene oxygenase-like [Salvia hispanica]|uniref:premnaspirodiene oxygenase-like n=1 Tax=Salvia hispanica TaxID=49212 RepID=UPI0020096DDD|nr:premnaspirodiene oxygenase-like [Salvia hispanica]
MAELITTVAALILSAIFVFLFNNRKKSRNSKSIKLPPGPRKLPIIGNLHQISNPPFPCFRDLSNQYGPLMHLKLGESPVVIVSSPDLVKKMLKDLDPVFADRRQRAFSDIMMYGSSDIAFGPYGGYWRQMRKLCINELLSPKMVHLFQSIRSDETSRLVDSLRESSGRVVDLTEKIFFHASSVTCRAAYGSVVEDGEALVKLTADTAMASGFEIADLFPSLGMVGALSWTKRRLKTMRRKLDVILDDVIERHKRNRAKNGSGNSEFGSEDMVDVFLRVKEEGQLEFPIDNDNIKAVLYDVFVAGTDTSAGTIDWTMTELLRHPQVMAKAQAEVRQALKGNSTQQSDIVHNLKYLKLVIKETMRLHPAFPMVSRASKEEQMINGYTIPAGEWVVVNIWGMHRDPRYWKDPEMFKPERFEDQSLDFVDGECHFLPFGAGKRMCPGITFGLANVEFTLAQLLYNFDWGLPEGVRSVDLDMTEHVGLTCTRKHDLSVVVTPYLANIYC